MSAPVSKDPLEALYLSRQDVRDLARHDFYIAINHGYH